MQLEACLRSIERHAPYTGSITVIYRATTESFRKGYAQIPRDGRARLVEQGQFESDVVAVLHEAGDRVVFHTDDDLFFRTPPGTPLLLDGCASFSLRLGENTIYCYPFSRDQTLPNRERAGDFIVWNWQRAENDFAYPMSLNGHIFEGDMLRSLIAGVRFRDPNDLERELHFRRHRVPRLMISFRQNSCVSVPLNVVTDSIVNRSGLDPRHSPEALNERFLRGERIDLDAVDYTDVRAAHEEFHLTITTPNNPASG